MDHNELINSGESAKQLLRLEDESLISPKESGRKRCKLK